MLRLALVNLGIYAPYFELMHAAGDMCQVHQHCVPPVCLVFFLKHDAVEHEADRRRQRYEPLRLVSKDALDEGNTRRFMDVAEDKDGQTHLIKMYHLYN